MPSLNQMRSFAAVYLHGSTVRAAELMGRSQSQVSADLRALELDLGLALFVRANGRLQATGNAAQLYDRVTRVFEAYDGVRSLARGRGAANLSIGATRSLSMTVLPLLVRALRQRDPSRAVSVSFHSYPDLIQAVAEGQLDQAIVKQPVADPRLQEVVLGSAPFIVVLRHDDALAALPEISVVDIGDRPIVRTGNNSPAWRAVQQAFAATGATPRSEVSMDGVGPICRMVAQGEGLAVVSRMLASGYLQDLGLVTRPFIPRSTETFTLIGHALLGSRADLVVVADILRELVHFD
ncbi:LysR family transcriptional regulator [Paracoccus sp. p4-l81]|uniref:LysR family transcriptional regulator n=1 Tax=Paracoccus sp. p4-l81 TaxID=3342806 RepID=UPI0035B887F0